MPAPDTCATLEEVRAEIDRIDHAVVALLGERAGYVHAAARFKSDEASVRVPEREEAMIAQRRRWAVAQGLSSDMVEQLFRTLIAYFVGRELETWRASVGETGADVQRWSGEVS